MPREAGNQRNARIIRETINNKMTVWRHRIHTHLMVRTFCGHPRHVGSQKRLNGFSIIVEQTTVQIQGMLDGRAARMVGEFETSVVNFRKPVDIAPLRFNEPDRESRLGPVIGGVSAIPQEGFAAHC